MRTFEKYISQIMSLLCKGMSEERRDKTGCYDFLPSDISTHTQYFKNCFEKGLPPDESLILFYDYLHEL